MCDMAALSSRTPTNLGFTLATQANGPAGLKNRYGWGLALYRYLSLGLQVQGLAAA